MLLQTWGNILAESFNDIWVGVFGFVPELIVAIIIFIAGWVVGAVLGRALKLDGLEKKIDIVSYNDVMISVSELDDALSEYEAAIVAYSGYRVAVYGTSGSPGLSFVFTASEIRPYRFHQQTTRIRPQKNKANRPYHGV